MLLEGKDNVGGGFQIGYTYSTFASLNWTAHRKPYAMIPRSGNPYLTYVPERNALLALYGNMTGPGEPGWTTRAAYAYMTTDFSEIANWVIVPRTTFVIYNPSFSVCDPDLTTFGSSSSSLMLSYSWNQSYDASDIAQSYYSGTLLQFFDQLSGYTIVPPNVSGLLILIPFFLTLGIVLIPVAKIIELSKAKRMLRVDEVVRMVLTIVVGMALVGITYTMI
jgi:hypothetical protein